MINGTSTSGNLAAATPGSYVTGSITAANANPLSGTATANSAVSLPIADAHSSWDAFINGTFSAGTTLQFQGSLDNVNWFSLNGRRNTDATTNDTTNFIATDFIGGASPAGGNPSNWRGVIGAIRYFRVTCLTYTASDNITVQISTSAGVGPTFLNNVPQFKVQDGSNSAYNAKVNSAGDQSVTQGLAGAVTNGWPTIGGELAADAVGTFTNATQTTNVSTLTVAASIDGYNTCLVSLSGTYTGASGVFEYTDDGGATWYTCGAVRGDGTGLVDRAYTLISTPQTWFVNVGGADAIRVRSTAVATGTVNVRISTLSEAVPGALPHGVSLLAGTSYVGSHGVTSPNASALGMYANVNPYGTLRVTTEPSTLFMEPFDSAGIDANRWGSWSGVTAANGALTLAPAVGANVNNVAYLISQPTFTSPGVGFITFSNVATLEAAQTASVNVHRFWGKGQVTTFAYATPLTDAVGFEVDGATGALQCVVYVGGTKYVINSSTVANITSTLAGAVAGGTPAGTALPSGAVASAYGKPLTWMGGQHRYAMMIRSDVVYWFVEGTEVPVAVLAYNSPNVQGLPIRMHSITNSAATSLANTFTIGATAVNDSTGGNTQLSDGKYPHLKAQVGFYGGLSVKGAALAAVSTGFAAGATGSTTVVAVSEMGNITFTVKNTVAATAYTGTPVIVFEQSDDATSWAPLAVTRSDTLYPASTHTLAAGVANVEIMFDAAVEGVNYVRARVTTGTTANGMTINITGGGLAFNPAVAMVNRVDAARTSVAITANAPNTALAAAANTETLLPLNVVRGLVGISTNVTTYQVAAGKTLRLQALSFTTKSIATTATAILVSLRVNPAGGGVISVSSAILWSGHVNVPATTTQGMTLVVPLPDGIELPAGANVGISYNQSTASIVALACNLNGFEY